MQWKIDVVKLKTGASFGELALLKNAPRAATIKCLTDCFFAVLDKDDYMKIIKRIHYKEETKKANFFLSIPFFKDQT